jgi:hypothetical protein
MTSLLLCWYSLGWVACGVDFMLAAPEKRASVFSHLITGPIRLIFLLFIVGILVLINFVRHPRIDQSKQYLWRKP